MDKGLEAITPFYNETPNTPRAHGSWDPGGSWVSRKFFLSYFPLRSFASFAFSAVSFGFGSPCSLVSSVLLTIKFVPNHEGIYQTAFRSVVSVEISGKQVLIHRLPHEVVILKGQRFPRCSKCTSSVLFELAHAAPDLFQSSISRIYELPVVEQTQPLKQKPSCA